MMLIMGLNPMPFITGKVNATEPHLRLSPPQGNLVALVPLSKVQEVLWLDYLRRPSSIHYVLVLEVNFAKAKLSSENIVNLIHRLSMQHDMLRTTFHIADTAQDVAQSYMAVHDPANSLQNVEIISDEAKLESALRRPFDLSTEYPVRWIIQQRHTVANGCLDTSHKVFVIGHHIAVDGSSMSYLSQQLVKAASLQSCAEQIPEKLPASYGEFVQRQNAYLRSQDAAAAQQFWLSQVQGTTPYQWKHDTISTPTLSVSHDYRKIHTWAYFSTEELSDLSKLYSTSWFRVATSILGLVLACHSTPSPHHDHTLQVAFGAREAKFADCVSHMANTMPIRQPISELLERGSTFANLVKNVGKRISQAKKHEKFPYISLLEAASQQSGGKSSMADKVAVTFSPRLADDSCSLYPVQGVWDLFFCFLEHADGVSLGVIADPLVFNDIAMESLKADFTDTVRLCKEKKDFQLDSIACLQDRAVSTLISGPEITNVDAVSSSRVTDWIHQRAVAHPKAAALVSGEEKTSITYEELHNMSDGRALYLQKRGLCRNDIVAIHIDRSFETVIWILAVLKSGAAYTVLDKNLPLARKRAILRVAEVKLFITDLMVDTLFVSCAAAPEVLNTRDRTDFSSDGPQRLVDQHPSDLAYLIFTSGSTGQPKAIMVEHQNLSSYVSSTRNTVKVGPGSHVLQFATFAFDASVLEWAVTLSYGATLCFVNHPSLLVGDYLAEMIDLNSINFFHTTPSVLSTISDGQCLQSLTSLSVGGEASSAGLLDKWSKKLRLIHAYGPTETTVICANEVLATNAEELPSPSNIGFANPGTRIIVCSENSTRPLEQGQTGEICILGPQVTRGYKGQPELNAEKFCVIELEGESTRMYRSGDKGFLDAKGKLHIMGRLNNREVKLRGYRIDPPAIEKSILDHCPEVMIASVQIVDQCLVSFVTPSTVQGDSIRERISKDLPPYSVPTLITAVGDLPLNANGKVDHKQVIDQFRGNGCLPMPQTLEAIKTPVTTETLKIVEAEDSRGFESSITGLWQEILGRSNDISLDATFYDVGGHSILLTSLHKKIATRWPEAKMTLVDAFYHPTIRRQAAYLMQQLGTSGPPSTVGFSARLDESLGKRTESSRTSITSGSRVEDELFAIVGMSGRFPGADSVTDMWDLLMEQRDGIATSDGSGAKNADLQDDEVWVPRYGAVNGLDDFHGQEWAMSDEEAENLDPQKRLFLLVAKQALKDARITAPAAESTNIGTFVGIAHNTFQHSSSKTAPMGSFESRHRVVLDPNASTFTAYKLNLTGPSVDINTACASSLVAVHQAINSLRVGDCDAALVGGVSVSYPQLGGYATSDGKIFSISGECRPLDARSDGSVPSDGVAAVVLKSLSAAKAAGDRIYAVIEGHAIGTDGAVEKTGFAVPSSAGQARVVCDAIVDSSVDTQAIRYAEMHGSGTSIGDALEARGLELGFTAAETAYDDDMMSTSLDAVSAFSNQASNNKLLVGSNKGTFGNSETASGLVSLIKASLAVWKGVMPPMRQLGEVNSMIDLSVTRVEPIRSHLKLEQGDRVGVTALGYGGVNACCIIASQSTVESRRRRRGR